MQPAKEPFFSIKVFSIIFLLLSSSLWAESQSILFFKDGDRLIATIEAWTGSHYLVRKPDGRLSRIDSQRIHTVMTDAFPRNGKFRFKDGSELTLMILKTTEDGILVKMPEGDSKSDEKTGSENSLIQPVKDSKEYGLVIWSDLQFLDLFLEKKHVSKDESVP